jgi:predicted GNAT family N-acyltransferase
MPIKIIDHQSTEYEKMIKLRLDILRQPLGLTFDDADLAKEKDDILIASFDEDEMLACCLLTDQPNEELTLKLRQMAVKGNLQGKGVGQQMLAFAENIARDLGNKKLMMHARLEAVGFYEKAGYKKVGNMFEEVTIPHYRMEKKIRE